MRPRLLAPLGLILAAATCSTAVLAEAVTTRIETRPYYGAIVTVERGVRVWRPLPPHDRIIINPQGKASVNLELKARNGHSNGNGNSYVPDGYLSND